MLRLIIQCILLLHVRRARELLYHLRVTSNVIHSAENKITMQRVVGIKINNIALTTDAASQGAESRRSRQLRDVLCRRRVENVSLHRVFAHHQPGPSIPGTQQCSPVGMSSISDQSGQTYGHGCCGGKARCCTT